jgi:tRNA(Ile)-lysidine synthase
MINDFKQFIEKQNLFGYSDKLVVGISGGIDSVSLCYLLHEAGYEFAMAHCNFGLRADESDGDEEYVRQLADKLGCTLHVTRFETEWYASENEISIQMAARDLRYQWFESLCKGYGYQKIVIAHNLDDSLETFFINLTRGTGLRGLTGIAPINGNVVRPLLFASRKQISQYIEKINMSWREDSTNAKLKYLRNKIRHQLLPFFEELNPNFRNGLSASIQRLDGAAIYFDKSIRDISNQLIKEHKGYFSLSIDELMHYPSPEFLLAELLLPYGFTGTVSTEIFESLNGIAGKQFFSATHRLVKDRTCLLISAIASTLPEQYVIEPGNYPEEMPLKMRFELCDWNYKIPTNPNIAVFDASQVTWPLLLRRWQKGDYFIPLGMNNMKKVSDYFTDAKFSLIDKENTWLLTSQDRIMWIVGHRIDHRFRVTGATKKVIQVTLIS